MRLVAMRKTDVSIGCWGMFAIPAERVEISMTDHGRNPLNGDYIAVFEADGRKVSSAVGWDVIRRGGWQARERCDYETLQREFGVDLETVHVL